MDTFITILYVHIASGSLALMSGLLNMSLKKGGKRHQIIGRVFAVSMSLSAIASFALAIIHPNDFLFITGIFTLYMTVSGYSKLSERINDLIGKPFSYLMILTALYFIFKGLMKIPEKNPFSMVFFLFAFIGIRFAIGDLKLKKDADYKKRVRLHLQRMSGAFIAAFTAFLVVNNSSIPLPIPGFIFWILPTAVITPFIVYWSRKYSDN